MGVSVGRSQEELTRDVMDLDRPYRCLVCHSGFKFEWHLTAHTKICAGEKSSSFVCETCHKNFTNNKSRKFHQKTCTGRKEYKCSECDKIFGTLQQRIKHKRIHHTAEECEFCGVMISQGQNMRRHIKLAHSTLTPRTAKLLELLKERKEEGTHIESTEDVMGDKELQPNLEVFLPPETDTTVEEYSSEDPILPQEKKLLPSETNITVEECTSEDPILPQEKNKTVIGDAASKPEAGTCSSKKKKKVSWNENLTTTKEIERKVRITKEAEEEVMAMIDVFKKFLPLLAKRKSVVELDDIIENYERNSKKRFNELTFQIIVSLQTKSFQTFTEDNKTYVDIANINISLIENIIKTKIRYLIEDKVPYIYLLPLRERKKYESAKEVLEKNIHEFSDKSSDSEAEEEDFNNNLSRMERLMKKVGAKNEKAKKRAMKFQAKLSEWQRNRLPKLARIVNKIYIAKEKNVIKTEELMQYINNSDFSSMSIDADFKKLVMVTEGWLTRVGDYVKRKPEDIETIIDLIMKEKPTQE